jgi:hypothetical protein
MIRNLKYISLLICSLFFLGCSSDDDSSDQNAKDVTLIFGWFSDNSCSGSCATIYKLADEKVYRDNNSTRPNNQGYQGNFEEIENADFLMFSNLITELPNQVFDNPNGYLGCDGCNDDLGGLYFEYISEEESGLWKIRNAQLPNYMEDYRSLMIDKLAELNEL